MTVVSEWSGIEDDDDNEDDKFKKFGGQGFQVTK